MKIFNIEIACPICEKKDCSLSGMGYGFYRVICYSCSEYVFYCDENGEITSYTCIHTYNKINYKLISDTKNSKVEVISGPDIYKIIYKQNIFVNPNKAKKY